MGSSLLDPAGLKRRFECRSRGIGTRSRKAVSLPVQSRVEVCCSVPSCVIVCKCCADSWLCCSVLTEESMLVVTAMDFYSWPGASSSCFATIVRRVLSPRTSGHSLHCSSTRKSQSSCDWQTTLLSHIMRILRVRFRVLLLQSCATTTYSGLFGFFDKVFPVHALTDSPADSTRPVLAPHVCIAPSPPL